MSGAGEAALRPGDERGSSGDPVQQPEPTGFADAVAPVDGTYDPYPHQGLAQVDASWEQPPQAQPQDWDPGAAPVRRTRGSGRNLRMGSARRSPRAATLDRAAAVHAGVRPKVLGWFLLAVITSALAWLALSDAISGNGEAVPWVIMFGVLALATITRFVKVVGERLSARRRIGYPPPQD
jgi:hypothetical protein